MQNLHINDRAFNLGSDARVAGVPLCENPFPSAPGYEYTGWQRGWHDANRHYAELVRGRWRYRPLPNVVEVATC